VGTNGLFAQEIDTIQEISKIRKQYGKIINKQIENIQVIEIDNSYKPTEEEMEEAPFAAIEKFYIYHNTIDTFLIRQYNMNDEGGAFSHSIEEVLFWDNKPFFHYRKTYGSWEQVLEESRVYIAKGNVIQKLTKKSNVPWSELPSDFYDLQTDIPNQNNIITQNDFNSIKYFIESSIEELKNLKNK
jgi:hypothetical protein